MGRPALLDDYARGVEEEVRALLRERLQPLYRLMEYQLGWVDEQGTPTPAPPGEPLYGLLCPLACHAAGGQGPTALPAAAALELLHHFTLVHQDIQGGNPERARRPAVWWVWGPAQAINAGDGLHALSRLALLRLEGRGVPPERVLEALRLLDQAALLVCEGQYLDLLYLERLEVTQEAYVQMAEKRTGSLIGCALEMGALVAGAGVSVRQAFAAAGRQIGVAFQVLGDLRDLWGRPAEKPPVDLLNKRKTLPVVHALQRVGLREKRELGALYMKRVLEPADLPRLVSILDSVGARESSQEVARTHREEALALLKGTGLPLERLGVLAEGLEYFLARAQEGPGGPHGAS